MAQLIKCLPQKYEYLNSDTQYPYIKPNMAACACNPRVGKVEIGRSLELNGQTTLSSVSALTQIIR